jgi:hypothetical protein
MYNKAWLRGKCTVIIDIYEIYSYYTPKQWGIKGMEANKGAAVVTVVNSGEIQYLHMKYANHINVYVVWMNLEKALIMAGKAKIRVFSVKEHFSSKIGVFTPRQAQIIP